MVNALLLVRQLSNDNLSKQLLNNNYWRPSTYVDGLLLLEDRFTDEVDGKDKADFIAKRTKRERGKREDRKNYNGITLPFVLLFSLFSLAKEAAPGKQFYAKKTEQQ